MANSNQTGRKNFVLIDHENVPVESVADLNRDPFHVMLFIGVNQKRVSINLARTVHKLGSRAEFVDVSGSGHNALDFHIAFYIGQLSKDHPEAFFHIVSGDTGFDSLIRHLKSKKIFAGRWPSIAEIPIVKSSKNQSPKERAVVYLSYLHGKKLPKPTTKVRLLNSISACFHKQLAENELTAVLKALVQSGSMTAEGERVTWCE